MSCTRLMLTVAMASSVGCGDSPGAAGPLDGGDAAAGVDAGWWEDAGEAGIAVCATGDALYHTLAEAIAAVPDGAILDPCPGTYAENLIVEGRRLHVRGIPGQVIVDGGGAGTVITVGPGADLVLTGLVVRGGEARHGGGIQCILATVRGDALVIEDNVSDGGGGLWAADCDVALTGSTVRGNLADDGAGLHVIRGNLDVVDSTVADNHASWIAGGLYVIGGQPVLRGNLIEQNSSVSDGAGLYLDQTEALLEGNIIRGNSSAEDAGGIRIFTSAVRLYGNQVTGNQAVADGGGMKISHRACDLRDNLIAGNSAGSYGGGLELDNDNSTVRGGVISGNLANRGGGIHMSLAPLSGGLIEDVRVVDNRAGTGAGIYLEENFEPITLRRITVTGNHAEIGGGVAIRRTRFTLTNSLIAGNQADERGGGLHVGGDDYPLWEEDCLCPPSAATGEVRFVVFHGNRADGGAPAMWLRSPELTVADSIVSGHDGTAVATGSTTPVWQFNNTWPAGFAGMADPTGGNGNLSADPMFVDPPGSDFHLRATSPCIDAGDPAEQDRDASRADMGLFGGPEAP